MYLGKAQLTEIGILAVEAINDNVRRGVDGEGRPLEPYRSIGHWMKKNRKRLTKTQKKQGKTAMDVFGSQMRSTQVDMQHTGEMMAALTYRVDAASNSVTLFFATKRAERKAFWHNISGAGKSRVLRKFMGLQPGQINKIKETVPELAKKGDVAFKNNIALTLQKAINGAL
jgi:hypothetical protein